MYVFIPVFRGDELVHFDVNCPDDNLNMFDKYVVGRTPHTNITNIYKLMNMNKTNTYLILHWGETCPFCIEVFKFSDNGPQSAIFQFCSSKSANTVNIHS